MKTILENTKIIRAAAAAGAATTDVTSSVIDTQGYERITFIAALGAITGGGSVSMSMFVGSASNGVGAVEVETTTINATDADGDGLLVIEAFRPTGRYVHVVIERADENSVVDGIVALLSDPKTAPVDNDDLVDSISI